jgi:hypothetical protein
LSNRRAESAVESFGAVVMQPAASVAVMDADIARGLDLGLEPEDLTSADAENSSGGRGPEWSLSRSAFGV